MSEPGDDRRQQYLAAYTGAEQLGGKLNMTPAQLLANTGGADRLPIDAQQLVAIDVNAALGSPCLHLATPEAPPRPNLKSLPTRIERISTTRDSSLRKPTWSSAATAGVKGTATTASTPVRARACRRSAVVINFCAGVGLTTTSGSGSKVTTTALQPWSRASRTTASINSRCPRCTPSNTPMAIDAAPRHAQSSNASAATMRASSDSPAKKIRASSWEASIIEHRRSPAERHAP